MDCDTEFMMFILFMFVCRADYFNQIRKCSLRIQKSVKNIELNVPFIVNKYRIQKHVYRN